jgi:ankyrin repeat protein
MTPLILAASAGRIEVVQVLIGFGADVNAQNEGGHTALQYAASKGWKEVSTQHICPSKHLAVV